MILEILKFVTSDFWIFLGSAFFSVSMITSIGWSINAILVGLRGCPVPRPKIFD